MDTHPLRPRMKRGDVRVPTRVAVVAVVAAGVLVCYGANRLGWWWATPLTGLAAGLRWRRGVLAAFCVAVPSLAWGGDLFLQWTGADLTRVSKVTVGLAGLGNDAAWLGYVVTLAYAVLLCVAGAWLGAAARNVIGALRAGRPHLAGSDAMTGVPAETAQAAAPAADVTPTEEREVGSNV